MKVGRPLKTEIREKIALLLMLSGQAYAYELFKWYKSIFEDITMRNFYYNIKKASELGEIIVVDVKREVGDFTWGAESQRIYYTLGPFARTYPDVNLTARQKEQISIIPKREPVIDFEKEIAAKLEAMTKNIYDFKQKEAAMLYEDKTIFKNKIKNQGELLKEWIKSRFDKIKAHEIRIKIDEVTNKVN